jgi:hypothetical protein
MRSLVDSLSLVSGSVVVALISVALTVALARISRVILYPVWAVVVPLVISYCLYWLPVWLGNDPSEYGAWSGLVVGVWFVAGAVPSSVILFVLRKRRSLQPK